MKFDQAEIEVLALCAWCKNMPLSVSRNIPAEILDVLLFFKLIRPSRNGVGYRCTPNGYDLLHRAEIGYSQDKSYRSSGEVLMRRLHTAEITSFFWRYGADVFCDSPPAEMLSNIFLPSFALRRQPHANILGGSRLTGFYYAKDTTFIPYYVPKENNGIYPEVEQRTFRSETLLNGRSPHIIYTGEGDLQEIITTVSYKKERSKKSTTVYYRDAMDKFNCPVALVPLNLDGIRQLRILSVPDYRQRLVKNILAKDYLPPLTPQSDGRNKTTNFIIGIDCNIKRFENAIKTKKQTYIFVLPFQVDAVLKITEGTNAECFVLDLQQTEEFLGISNDLPEINYKPFQTGKGEYIHVPPLGKGKATGR